jgi:hypothetical protein
VEVVVWRRERVKCDAVVVVLREKPRSRKELNTWKVEWRGEELGIL